MSDSAVQITNLLYRYAEHMDAGELDAATALFRHAKVKSGGELKDEAGLREVWRNFVKLYPCGTPRTKHVVTNPILEIDEAAGRASCRSYYTVLQSAPDLPLQVIAAGRYHDEFERVDGRWRFAYRDYSLFDLPGNLGSHLLMMPTTP